MLTEIKGEKIQVVRDFLKEKQLQNKILQSCSTFSHLEKIENQWLVDDPEDALELLLELKECGDEVVLEWPQGEKFKVRRNVSFSNFSMQIKQEKDWFKATGSLQIDDALALDLRTLLDMLSRATGRFVPLDDGTFLGITGQLRKRLDELNAFSESHGKGVRFSPLAALALEDLTEAGDRRQTIDNLQAFDLLIVSYGLLPLETELLSSVKWQTVVLDEAQAIKNMQTKRSKAAMDLQAEFRIITTGTPVENHLGELWTLFDFSTSLKDRKQRIADFQNGLGDVFLISLKAGGA